MAAALNSEQCCSSHTVTGVDCACFADTCMFVQCQSMPVAYGMVLCYKNAASHMLAVACPRVLHLSAVPPPL